MISHRITHGVALAGLLACGGLVLFAGALARTRAAQSPSSVDRTLSRPTLVEVPFIQNEGQAAREVAYYANMLDGTLLVTHTGDLVLSLPAANPQRHPPAHLVESLVGSHVQHVLGEVPSPTCVSLFTGRDPGRWRRDVATYRQVSLGKPYEGIGLVLKAHGGNVEKVFQLDPWAEPAQIQVHLSGAQGLHVVENGELAVKTPAGTVRYSRPVAYQIVDGQTRAVQVAYRVEGNDYSFEMGDYDASQPLVIDPMLVTYLGGGALDDGLALKTQYIAADAELYVYVVGTTESLANTFPTHTTGAQPDLAGGKDVFIARFDHDLSMVGLTFLGGTGDDEGYDLAIHDETHAVFVAGFTTSDDFPTAAQAGRGRGGNRDAFVVRLSADLTQLEQSTYLGGSNNDAGIGVAIDTHPMPADPEPDTVYLVGSTRSNDLPATTGAAQAAKSGSTSLYDGFAARLSLDLEPMRITYLGGTSDDSASGVAINAVSHDVYVAGQTSYVGASGPAVGDFPWTTGGARLFGGYNDGFVVRLSMDLGTAYRASYVGGDGLDTVTAVLVNPSSFDVYVAGGTSGGWNPPPTGGAYTTYKSGQDAFVARFSADLTTLPSATFLGGTDLDRVGGMVIEQLSTASFYVSGWTRSSDFPDAAGGARSTPAGSEAFVVWITSDLSTVYQATYVGGGGADKSMGHGIDYANDPTGGELLLYVTGSTESDDLVANGAVVQTQRAGSMDAFVARVGADLTGDAIPMDQDHDGVLDEEDNCPQVANKHQADADGDGVGNRCDNCQAVPNPTQDDIDGDDIGDACEDNPGPTLTFTQSPTLPVLGDRVSLAVTNVSSPLNEIARAVIFIGGKRQRACFGTACTTTTKPITEMEETGALVMDTSGVFRMQGYVPDDEVRGLAAMVLEDQDGDGLADLMDNCVDVPNEDQADLDHDGVGDACDACCPGCAIGLMPPEYCCMPFYIPPNGDCTDDMVNSGGSYYWEQIYTDMMDNGCGCADSDGEDIFSQGGVFTETQVAQDCETLPTGPWGSNVIRCDLARASCTSMTLDTCADGNTVHEAVCGPEGVEFLDIDCPEENPVCEDGRCGCPDSDGGLNYYRQGTLLDNTDECFYDERVDRNRMREWSCGQDDHGRLVATSQSIDCPYGCSDGACSCEDSDGGINPEEYGQIGTSEDRCLDSRTLIERYAEVESTPGGGICQIRYEHITCEGICLDGACQLPTCEDRILNQGEEEIDCGGPCEVPCDLCSVPEGDLPTRFTWGDWKGQSWITPIQNQEMCGSCAAFASVAAVEAKAMIELTDGWTPAIYGDPVNTDGAWNLPDLSEQALLSGCTDAWVDCTGGSRTDVLDAIRDDGVPDQLCLDYTSGSCMNDDLDCVESCGGDSFNCSNPQTCPDACDDPALDWDSRIWTITHHNNYDNQNDVSGVKHDLVCSGPLVTCSGDWGHCVLIVGWDDESPICRTHYEEDGCWILKNSHGPQDGEHHNTDSLDDHYWAVNGFVFIPFENHDYSRQIRLGTHHVSGVNPPATWTWP